jgi:hypothetical protein
LIETTCPSCGQHPSEYLCAAQARIDAVRAAREEADALRLRALHRTPWSGADVRRFLAELARRDGVEWVEGGAARAEREDPPVRSSSSAERACESAAPRSRLDLSRPVLRADVRHPCLSGEDGRYAGRLDITIRSRAVGRLSHAIPVPAGERPQGGLRGAQSRKPPH